MISLPHNGNIAKILSVIMAFALWLYVMNEQNPPITLPYTVNLQVQGLPDNILLLSAPEAVRVKVRGTRSVVTEVSGKDIKAFVDMRGAQKGEYSKKPQIVLPNDMQLVEVMPEVVLVRTDDAVKRSMPVDVRYSGQLPVELHVASMTVVPRSARISGAESIVSRVARVDTLFNLDHKTAGAIKADTPLLAVDHENKPVEKVIIDPSYVSLAIDIVEKENAVPLPVKIFTSGSLSAGYNVGSITSNPTQIMLSGAYSLVGAVKEISTEEISLDGLKRDTVRKVRLRVPQGLIAEPDVVDVLIKVGKN